MKRRTSSSEKDTKISASEKDRPKPDDNAEGLKIIYIKSGDILEERVEEKTPTPSAENKNSS